MRRGAEGECTGEAWRGFVREVPSSMVQGRVEGRSRRRHEREGLGGSIGGRRTQSTPSKNRRRGEEESAREAPGLVETFSFEPVV